MLKKSLGFIILSFALIFIACEDNTTLTSETEGSSTNLLKVYRDDYNYTELTYQGDLVTSYKSVSNYSIRRSIEFTYSDSKFISKELFNDNYRKLEKYFLYDDQDRVIKIEMSLIDEEGNSQPYGYYQYSYSPVDDDFSVSQFSANDVLIFRTEYDYNENHNVVEKKVFSGENLFQVVTMLYDDKTDPWSKLNSVINYDLTLSKNNITRMKSVSYSGDDTQTITTSYDYTYRDDGYPVSRVVKTLDQNDMGEMYTEYYQYK